MKLEAWQKLPYKMLLEAIRHTANNTEEDNVIGFLLFDVGMETILRTYLTLPKSKTGATSSEKDRQTAAAEGGFKAVTEAVQVSRQDINKGTLDKVFFFHGIRNKLYHEGNGITVPRQHLIDYQKISIQLANQLLKIKVSTQENDPASQPQVLQLQKQIEAKQKELALLSNQLSDRKKLVIEKSMYEILLPSFVTKFNEIASNAISESYIEMIGEKEVEYDYISSSKEHREMILRQFEELVMPLVEKSTFKNLLNEEVPLNHLGLEAHKDTIHVNKLEVEYQKVPNVLSFIASERFDIEVLQTNVVDIIVFGEAHIAGYLNFWNTMAEGDSLSVNAGRNLSLEEEKVAILKNVDEAISHFESAIAKLDTWLNQH